MYKLFISIIFFICAVLGTAASPSLDSILEPLKKSEPTIKPEKKVERILKVIPDKVNTVADVQLKQEEIDKPVATSDTSKKQMIKASEILTQAAKHLSNTFNLDGEIRLNPITNFKPISVNVLEYNIVFTQLPVNGLSSSFTLAFKIISQDQDLGSWSMPIHCELWKDVFITQRPFKRGETLNPNSLTLSNVDVLRVAGSVVDVQVDIENFEASRQIQAQKILTSDTVSPKPDVRKGKVVEIVAHDGLMRLSTKAVALQNGAISDFIKVRNLQSKRDIEAQIINENTVRVFF